VHIADHFLQKYKS